MNAHTLAEKVCHDLMFKVGTEVWFGYDDETYNSVEIVVEETIKQYFKEEQKHVRIRIKNMSRFRNNSRGYKKARRKK